MHDSKTQQSVKNQILCQFKRDTQVRCNAMCGATRQQTASFLGGGQSREHSLDGANLCVQATTDDGIRGILWRRAETAFSQWQLCSVSCQRSAHQIDTRQDQSATEYSACVEPVDSGRRSRAYDQAVR